MAPNAQTKTIPRFVASRTQRTRSQDGSESPVEDNTAKRPKRAKKRPMAKRRRVVDTIFQHVETDLEMPLESDLSSLYSGLPATTFRWATAAAVPQESLEDLKAQPPMLPDPFDDSPRLVAIEPEADDDDDDDDGDDDDGDDKRRPKETTRGKKVQALSNERVATAEKASSKLKNFSYDSQGPPKTREPRCFTNIPAHIRDVIYRELLIADKSIPVHGVWCMVYQRHKPIFFKSILLVNRMINEDATRIMYSENTFLYRLRDAIPVVTNVNTLAQDDSGHPNTSSDDEDSAYEEAVPRGQGRCRRRRDNAQGEDGDIDINKYKPLIRNIIVEAEPNRFSDSTQDGMARAIRVFGQCEKRKIGKDAPNIRTLTIRVAPLRNPDALDDDESQFTFVNFFEPGSAVIQAVKVIECQFLHLELVTPYMNGESKKSGCRLVVDMRHHRINREVAATSVDFWGDDVAMQRQRLERVKSSAHALEGLRRRVLEFCNERVTKTVGGVDVLSEDFADELDDVFEFGDDF